ncbi:response regulator transcription factor [Paucibacter sp. B51]|uniref:response regulator transcription factor n=1 Tax=Paucibacter sp. B51 TaxID=2993315 RepID=UPI000BCBDF50|nr:response regulator [Paucibacter sp. B51]OYU25702.1 MAG: two-component system response regulator [Burkholderiales bacterium PBB2]
MKKILIVDDHADIRRLIRMTLEFEDYEIHEASNGDSALERALALQPDFVLMDVMMPGGMDGLEACRRIRAEPSLRNTHVILLSARGQSQDKEAGLKAGAHDYLVKPFSPLRLIDALASLWLVD